MSTDEGSTKLPDLPTLRGDKRPRGRGGRLRARHAQPTEHHVDELAILGELMMGAAYADGHKASTEVIVICEQLKGFVEAELLPDEVKRRLDHFDPERFDIEATCARLEFSDDHDRLALLQLVATVVGADSVVHDAETVYLNRVARAVGLDPARLSLTLK